MINYSYQVAVFRYNTMSESELAATITKAIDGLAKEANDRGDIIQGTPNIQINTVGDFVTVIFMYVKQ